MKYQTKQNNIMAFEDEISIYRRVARSSMFPINLRGNIYFQVEQNKCQISSHMAIYGNSGNWDYIFDNQNKSFYTKKGHKH